MKYNTKVELLFICGTRTTCHTERKALIPELLSCFIFICLAKKKQKTISSGLVCKNLPKRWIHVRSEYPFLLLLLEQAEFEVLQKCRVK